MQHLNQMLLAREDEYIAHKPLKLFCGTFNVNGKQPDESLRSWLGTDRSASNIDMYAIGFQEVVDLSTTSFLLQTDWLEREQRWTTILNEELGKYSLVNKIRMCGIFLLIFVRENIAQSINELLTSYVPTGIMDSVGNKGSVAVSLRIYETRICFICSHFASDTDKLEKRNADYRSSKLRLRFEYNAVGDFYTVDEHDIVFWFGDLNYRLDNISLSDTIRLIYSNENVALLQHDQLTLERRRMRVFEEFNEGRIEFRPTYKYVVKTDTYEKQATLIAARASGAATNTSDTLGRVKLPSWTDRILWKSNNTKVTQVKYSCINTITISDHKPVYAIFDVQLKKIDETKYSKVYEELMRDTDRKSNEEMPRITLVGGFNFNFGNVQFYDMRKLQMSVRNEGMSRATVDIHFYDDSMLAATSRDENKDAARQRHYHPHNSRRIGQWMEITPLHKERVEPGAVFQVDLTLDLDRTLLERFNVQGHVDDFLILRCMNGNDLFATVSADYTPTIMGISLKALSTLSANTPFEKANKRHIIDKVEKDVSAQEARIDLNWSEHVNSKSQEAEIIAVQRMLSNTQSAQVSKINGKVEMYQRCMNCLKTEILDIDPLHKNDLSAEYVAFMQSLTSKALRRISAFDEKAEEEAAAELDLDTSPWLANMTIEDRKNLVLAHLSNKKDAATYDAFDVEILAEILYDLLYALPHPLIPTRFFDYCVFAEGSYETAVRLIAYLPRTHAQLLELIVRFLQIYMRCLSTCGSSYNSILADAIFHVDLASATKAGQLQRRGSKQGLAQDARANMTREDYRSITANKFLQLLIDNHTKFQTIQ